MTAPQADCQICAKHQGSGLLVGPVIFADDLVTISHRADGWLGYAFIETRRHVSKLEELTGAEAVAVGMMRSRLATALAAELAVEHVHSMVAGLGVPHFHEHVFVRHRGTLRPRSAGTSRGRRRLVVTWQNSPSAWPRSGASRCG